MSDDPPIATVGIGGPVGAGKTSLIARLLPKLRDDGHTVGVIANDISSHEDANALRERFAATVSPDLIAGIEAGSCPRTGLPEDASATRSKIAEFAETHPELDLVLLESSGGTLAVTFKPDIVDYSLYVISVAAGDDIPRKRGPGVVECDLLVVNKTDLADHVSADLTTIERDARTVRDGPFRFTNCNTGEGVDSVLKHIRRAVLFE